MEYTILQYICSPGYVVADGVYYICTPGYVVADGEDDGELYEEPLDLLLLGKERSGDGHIPLHSDREGQQGRPNPGQ